MMFFLLWYVLATLLGWLTFPLAYHLFPALKDRGYTLSRALGLLIWAYAFWLFASFGIAQNDIGGLLLGLLVLAGLSAWAFFSDHRPQTMDDGNTVNGQWSIVEWVRGNKRFIITAEILFFAAFAFMAFIRAGNPEILGTEKPMELMMINGILNSPTFPPRDLWLSGYSISYYYFGFVMTSMLAMLTGTPVTAAFNLMIALVFALSAVGAYGILYNLLANYKSPITEDTPVSSLQSPITALIAPLFLLLVSNVEGFLEVLHRRGLFWTNGNNFWTWLDLPELRDAPAQPLGWIPDRFWWWWRASRVVQDYDLTGAFTGDTIDEFPFFSYLLGDLHPHLLSMPFVLLMVALALNIFLGGLRGRINLYVGQLHISKTGFFLVALTLGGLAFLNMWDPPAAAALIASSYALARVRESGWRWERIEDVLLLAIPAGVTAYVMYLPFFLGFDSQAGGLLPNFMFPTRGAQLWVMWGTLFVPLLAFLIHLLKTKTPADWRTGFLTTGALLLALLAAMFAIGLLALRFKPDLVLPILESQGRGAGAFVADGFLRRLSYIGSLITLLALLIPASAFLFANHRPQTMDDEHTVHRPPSTVFVLLLITLGTLLILGPDFLYLRDNFGWRLNTVFKLYYQAWILLSLAAAFGTAVLLTNLRGASKRTFRIVFALVLIVGLTYPALGIFNKTNNFTPPYGLTLDDFDRVQIENPDEAAAILWLRSAPDGVIVEATRPFAAYSAYGRISIYTGLPTVIGWGNHEGQWRDYALQGTREQDIETLYTTPDAIIAQEIVARYNIRYIYVGGLERSTYPVDEGKFYNLFRLVFQQGNVTIYEVP
jgi:YYY domain-containing protein